MTRILGILSMVLLLSTVNANASHDTTGLHNTRKVFMGMTFKNIINDEVYDIQKMPNDTPILIMYFMTDCGHCKMDAERLPSLMKEYEIPMWMASFQDKKTIDSFATHYKLKNISNLTLLQDYTSGMGKWFTFRYVPFIALIDKRGNFIKEFEKLPTPEELSEILRTNAFIEMYDQQH